VPHRPLIGRKVNFGRMKMTRRRGAPGHGQPE